MQMETACMGKPFFGHPPVHYMEPVLNIGCTEIVMFQIVGVLPHVNIEKERPGVQERSVLVLRGDDL